MILFFLFLILFMPTPLTLNLITSVVSPSPISRTRTRRSTLPVTMSDFTSVNFFTYRFSPHHLPSLATFDRSMNNLYSDTFDDATVASLFTDESRTVVAVDAIPTIRLAIINSMFPESTADLVTISQIVNSLTLYAINGRPER